MIDLIKLRNELKRDEGLRLFPYYDTKGVLTIGVGRNLNEGISETEADYMLDNDIQDTIEDAHKFKWFEEISPARKHVILNMLFNLGLSRFKTFKKMIRAIELDQWALASVEALESKWAKQDVGSKRSTSIAETLRTGEFQ